MNHTLEQLADWLRWPLTTAYLLVLAVLCVYGLHRLWLTGLYFRTRRIGAVGPRVCTGEFACETSWPRVTVQLPMFNESAVAERVIEAACWLDYPSDRLQVQVLDDSTDECAAIARNCCERMKAAGHDVRYIHREHRGGYKAGALIHAMGDATGELIAVFDADFVPPGDFLRRAVPHFEDGSVGMVQAAWDHLNEDASWLTRGQAVYLDGHFVIEHTARNRSGRWMNFNGTAGVWRRAAIEAAGGWSADTLTEDVDLSYRAQLAGWRFVYLPDLFCPAELPPCMTDFKSQQHRWTKGSIQTAKKLLPTIVRSRRPWRNKIEAVFHLTAPAASVAIVVLTLLLLPAMAVNVRPFDFSPGASLIAGVGLFVLATTSAGVFYAAAQRQRGRGWAGALLRLPLVMGLGIGISLNNAKAVIEAVVGHRSPFARTPKYGNRPPLPGAAAGPWLPMLEIAAGFYMVACLMLSLTRPGMLMTAPFLALFAFGYLFVGIHSWRERRNATITPHAARRSVPSRDRDLNPSGGGMPWPRG